MKEKTAIKRRALLAKPTTYPDFNILDYDISLSKNLNYYSSEVDADSKRQYVLDYWKSQGKHIVGLARLDSAWFGTAGAVAHMIHVRDLTLRDDAIEFLETKYNDIKDLWTEIQLSKSEPKDSEELKPQKTKVDVASIHIAELESMRDDFLQGKNIDVNTYLVNQEITRVVAKDISNWFTHQMVIVESDKEIGAYDFLSKEEFVKYREFLNGIIKYCDGIAKVPKPKK